MDASVQTVKIIDVKDEMRDLQQYIYYCCDQCEFKSKEGMMFKLHLDENHNDIKPCLDELYTNAGDYENDPDITNNLIALECLKCPLNFENDVDEFIDHMKSSHVNAEESMDHVIRCKDYVCSDCVFYCLDLMWMEMRQVGDWQIFNYQM